MRPIISALSSLPTLIKHPSQMNQAQRLFHGRGHAFEGLSHVTVDWFCPVVLITLFEPEPLKDVEYLADFLLGILPSCTSVQLQHRYLRAGPIEVVRGKSISHVEVLEGDLKFHLSLGRARNTGLFLDMKNGRQWVEYNSTNKRVLNLFAYTCGFSVAALAGKASFVMNVDMSSSALSVGRDNHRLNKQSLDKLKFEKLDIFKSFGRLSKRGPFDLLICDPPTFQKGSVDIEKDYPKILRRLKQFMAPEATLMLCLNAPDLNRDFLIQHMAELGPEYALIEELSAPGVFVEAEDKGLTILVFGLCL